MLNLKTVDAWDGKFFQYLPSSKERFWGEKFPLTDEVLDILFMNSDYGNHVPSPMIQFYVNKNEFNDLNRILIASAAYDYFVNSWKKEYTALTADYSPIENTDKYITYTDESSGAGSQETTGTSTDNATSTGTVKTDSDIYGMNSDTPTGDTTATSTSNDTDTSTSESSGKVTSTSEGTVTHTEHAHGNIGVTTNQQMITEELTLRQTQFFDIVFKDISNFISLNIY